MAIEISSIIQKKGAAEGSHLIPNFSHILSRDYSNKIDKTVQGINEKYYHSIIIERILKIKN